MCTRRKIDKITLGGGRGLKCARAKPSFSHSKNQTEGHTYSYSNCWRCTYKQSLGFLLYLLYLKGKQGEGQLRNIFYQLEIFWRIKYSYNFIAITRKEVSICKENASYFTL